MKKLLLLLLLNLSFAVLSIAQAPEKLNYQGVARDNLGGILPNQAIGLRITLRSGTPTGTSVYQETHSTTTDAFGFFDLHIGGGLVVSGTFSTISWGTNSYYVQIEMDATGGVNYQNMGTTQLVSVPYALYSKTSGSSNGKSHLVLSGNITDAQAAQRIQNEFGPQTQFIWIINTTQLTTVNFPSVSEMVEIKIKNNSSLSSVSFPNLTDIWSGFIIRDNAALTLLSIPVLTTVSGDYREDNSEDLVGGFTVSGNSSLTSLSIPALTTVSGYFGVSSNSSLTSLSIPALTTVNDFEGFYASYNALPSSNINAILARLVAINPSISGWSIRLNTQTPLAPPTGQGITDRTTLINNGNSVTTD